MTTCAATVNNPDLRLNSSAHFVRCLEGGVELISSVQTPYEICADDFCTALWNPRMEGIILEEHKVQWKFLQGSAIRITHVDALTKTESFIIDMEPNVPIKVKAMTLTLSSVTIPPLPILNTPFISDGMSTALWDSNMAPPLQCDNERAAKELVCAVEEDCACYPAETRANCKCKHVNISEWLQNVQHHLPVILPSVTFREASGVVQAIIPAMTTAEIILNLQDQLQTEVSLEKTLCVVQNTTIRGCYNCAKGAQTQITCTSPIPTQAEITCGQFSFTVPCDREGMASTLRLSVSNARIHLMCSVSCGGRISSFEVTGVLKFTHTTHSLLDRWVNGKTKGLFLTVTYLYVSSCGLRCLWLIISSMTRILRQFFRAVLCYPWKYSMRFAQKMHNKILMSSEADGDLTPLALLYGNGYLTEDQVEMDLMVGAAVAASTSRGGYNAGDACLPTQNFDRHANT
ncbi:hypothetical protein OSTOST_15535 [Ostertagia ostertagi]